MRRDTTFQTPTATCSIERSLEVLGERWTFLVLRQAFAGTTRFSDFQARLGIATDVLARRLGTLVCAGVLEKGEYRPPGGRSHADYHLTPAGQRLVVVLGALQQWGDENLPLPTGPAYGRRDRHTGDAVTLAFVNDAGDVVPTDDVTITAPLTGPSVIDDQRKAP